MELPDLIEKYQEMQAQAERLSSHGSLAAFCRMVLADVADLNVPMLERSMKVEEAAKVLGVKPKTIRAWCRDEKFKGAFKTGKLAGDWRIPASAVYEMAGLRGKSRKQLVMEVHDVRKAS